MNKEFQQRENTRKYQTDLKADQIEWKKVSVNSARGTGTHPIRAAKRNKRMKKLKIA